MHAYSVYSDHASAVKPLNAVEVPDSVTDRDAVVDRGAVQRLNVLENLNDVMDLRCATVPYALLYVLLLLYGYAHVCTLRGRLWQPQGLDRRYRLLYRRRV